MTLLANTLEDMIAEAERRGMWLWCAYQDLWFSPAELRTANAAGRFRWGPINWTLRHPSEMLSEARYRLQAATDNLASLERRVAASVPEGS